MTALLRTIFCLLILVASASTARSERAVIGAMGYDSPLGCAPDSTFNLVAGFTLDTFSTISAPSTAHSFEILSNYNGGQGASFQVMLNGAGTLVTASAGLRPLSFFGNLQYSTANNPDVTNTIGTVALQGSDQMFLHGTNVVGGCAGPNCLHNYLWSTTGAGPGIDLNFTIGSANAAQGTLGGTTDGSNIYFLHSVATPPNTTMLWVFDVSATTTLGFLNVGSIVTREMIQSADSLYFVNGAGNSVEKVTKIGLARSSFPIAFSSLQDNIAYSASQDAFYIATISGGPTLTIRRYNGNFSANTHNLVIGNEVPSPYGLMMDERAQKLYLVSEIGGIKRIRRINPATLATEQTLSIPTLTNGFIAAPDFPFKNLWISDIGAPSHIQRIQLCT